MIGRRAAVSRPWRWSRHHPDKTAKCESPGVKVRSCAHCEESFDKAHLRVGTSGKILLPLANVGSRSSFGHQAGVRSDLTRLETVELDRRKFHLAAVRVGSAIMIVIIAANDLALTSLEVRSSLAAVVSPFGLTAPPVPSHRWSPSW